MKKILAILIVMILWMPLEATHKEKKEKKIYLQTDEIFLYKHGIYIAYPGKIFRLSGLYFKKPIGFFTYESKLKRIPLLKMDNYDW